MVQQTEPVIVPEGNLCWLCLKSVDWTDFAKDHLIPTCWWDWLVAKGILDSRLNRDDSYNLAPAHRYCNAIKSSRLGTPAELRAAVRWTLGWKEARRTKFRGRGVYPTWDDLLDLDLIRPTDGGLIASLDRRMRRIGQSPWWFEKKALNLDDQLRCEVSAVVEFLIYKAGL